MADVGYRIKVEGEQEFNAALKEINNNIKLNQAQLKLLTEEYNTNGGSAETLAEKSKVLQEAHDRQADKLQKMRDYYAKCADVMDETDPKMVKLATEITKQETELVKLNQQIDQNSKAMKAASSGVQGYDDDIAALDRSLEQSRAEMAQVDQALKGVDKATKDAETSTKGLVQSQENLSQKQENLSQKAELTARREETLTKAVDTQKTKCTELSKALQTAESTWGKNSEQADKYRLALTKAETELDKMQGELTETQAAAKQADDAMNGIGGKLPEATSNAQLLGGAFGDVGNKVGGILDQVGVQLPAGITDVIGQFGMMAGAAGAVVTAVVGIVDEINKARDEAAAYIDDLNTTASIADLPTDVIQEWQYMTDTVDVSVDTVIASLRKLKENMRDAREAGQSFLTVGQEIVPIYDEQTGELRDLNDVFLDTLDALKSTEDYLDRDGIAMELFGKKASELNPLLDQSRQNIEAMRQEAKESGYVTEEAGNRILSNYQNIRNMIAKTGEAYERNKAILRMATKDNVLVTDEERKAIESNVQASEKAYADYLTKSGNFFSKIWGYLLKIDTFLKENSIQTKLGATGYGGSYASGTSSATAGLSLTGEAGPEFYRVSGGSVSRRSGALASAIEAATGGRYSVLGEGGPELVNLHGGERIWPNGQIPADLRRLGINAAIRGYADGVMSAPAGMALAGERGPEIVRTSAAAGSGGEAGTVNNYYDVRIDASRIKEFDDIVRIAQNERRMRRMGYSGR